MKFRVLYTFFIFLVVIFISCENNNTKEFTEDDRAIYLKKGHEITTQTFAVLAGRLQLVMNGGGVSDAINYCNVNAIAIVDSLSNIYKCEVRRTTLNPRNPESIASKEEELILKDYEKKMLAKQSLDPIVQYDENKNISYYAPIKVNALCLQCHGEIGKTLVAENFGVIKEHYPNDKATGYLEGDLRGMWRVTFLESN